MKLQNYCCCGYAVCLLMMNITIVTTGSFVVHVSQPPVSLSYSLKQMYTNQRELLSIAILQHRLQARHRCRSWVHKKKTRKDTTGRVS